MLDLLPEEILVCIFYILDGYTLLTTSLVNRKLQNILTSEKIIREVCCSWNLPYFVNSLKFVSLYYDSYFHTTRTPYMLSFVCLMRSVIDKRLSQYHCSLYNEKKKEYEATRYTPPCIHLHSAGVMQEKKEPSTDETLLLLILKRELGMVDDLRILTRWSDLYLDSVHMKYVYKENDADKSLLYGSVEEYISDGHFRFSWTISSEKMAVLLATSRDTNSTYTELVQNDNLESFKVLLIYLRPRLTLENYQDRLRLYFRVASRASALRCFVHILEEMKTERIYDKNSLTRSKHTKLCEHLLDYFQCSIKS